MSGEEIYSPDEVQSFQRVGEYLAWFARLEAVMDGSIIDILNLEPTAGRLLLSFVSFSAKCNFLEELARAEGTGLTDTERKETPSNIEKIRKIARRRNTIAHSMFEPTGGGIKFADATKKKLAADRSNVIQHDVFDRDRLQMGELWMWVASTAAKIRAHGKQTQIAEAVLRARLKVAEPEPGSKPN